MSAVVVDRYGAPAEFSLKDIGMPEPGPGEVRVRVHAAGVSYVDSLIAAGRYQIRPSLPFTPGSEFAGEVDALGAGVVAPKVGAFVCGGGLIGAFAQYVCVPAESLVPLPPATLMDEAALLVASYATAAHALIQRGRIQAGETVLVLGAGGGVGFAAVQIARALGARVVAAASSQPGRALALSGGANEVIDSQLDLKRQLQGIDDGRPMDVVVDPVGGSATDAAFRTLGWGGRHLVIGFVAGMTALPTHLSLLKGADLIGVNLRELMLREPQTHAENCARIVGWYAGGRIKPPVAQRFPLTDFAAAMSSATQRHAAGRSVIVLHERGW